MQHKQNLNNKMFFIYALILLLTQNVKTQDVLQGNDKDEIKKMVEKFQRGIIDKDSTILLGLFLTDDVPFISVRIKDSLPTIKSIFQNSNVSSRFIRFVTSSPDSLEEKFSNIEVNVSEGVANMSSDYSFYRNNRMSNYGKEMWHLVKSIEGWKVSSVIWTSKSPDKK